MTALIAFLVLTADAILLGMRPRRHKKPWYRTWD